ncbi:MAG: hypothetical protein QXT35_06365 [Conexivisphaerales archaeon]
MSRIGITMILLELFLLLIQYLIGMWINLFAVFPPLSSYGFMYGMMQAMFSVPELMIHMMVGILIGIISLIILVLFAVSGDYVLSLLGAFASISILMAGISGLEFVFSGFANNVFSYIMSLGFIFAVMAYSMILYMVLNRTERA